MWRGSAANTSKTGMAMRGSLSRFDGKSRQGQMPQPRFTSRAARPLPGARQEATSTLDLARHPRDRMISFDASASQSEAVTWRESLRDRL
jgi:hypothetical protein